ncbi:MAG: hypothetical protein WC830_10165 [Burkholderiales bacterium]|jgi:hypothetical protein
MAFQQPGVQAFGSELEQSTDKAVARQVFDQRQADAEARAEAKRLKNLEITSATEKALIDGKNDLADVAQQSKIALQTGAIDRDKVIQDFNNSAGKLRAQYLKTVPPEMSGHAANRMDDYIRDFSRGLAGDVETNRRQQVAADIYSTREGYQREAARATSPEDLAHVQEKWALYGAAQYKTAGVPDSEIAKDIQNFKETTSFTYLDGLVTSAQKSNKALGELQAQITAGKYADLDPAKMNFLDSKIQRYQEHNTAAAAVAEQRMMTRLGAMQNRLSWYVENGQDIPTQEMDNFEKMARGTPYAGMTNAIATEQKQVADLAGKTPAQMQDAVKQLTDSYGDAPSKEQLTHLARVQKFVDKSIKLGADSPLTYAGQRGGNPLPRMDWSNPATWSDNFANMAERSVVLTEQQKRTGFEPKGLYPDEAKQLAQVFASATWDQRKTLLTGLRAGFGNDAVYRATLSQIRPDSPVTALAGMIASAKVPVTVGGWFSSKQLNGSDTADLILMGEDALNPTKGVRGTDGKPAKVELPKDDDLRRVFNEATKGAFAGREQAFQNAYQAARAAYAGLMIKSGDHSPDPNPEFMKEAVQRVTGGGINQRWGPVLKPWGMDDGAFESAIRAGVSPALQAAGLDASLKDQLIARGHIRTLSGNRYVFDGVTGKGGQPVIVTLPEPGEESALVRQIPK